MIPKILHFIWLQNSTIKTEEDYEVPTHILNNINTFAIHHPTWQLMVWKNASIKNLLSKESVEVTAMFWSPNTTLAQKTDILRMIILKHFGGFYCDSDMICVKSFDALREHDVVVAEEKAKKSNHMHATHRIARHMHLITNTVIGTIPRSKFTDKYFEELVKTKNDLRVSFGPKLVEQITYTLMHDGTSERIFIASYDTFIPVPYFDPHIKHIHLTNNTRTIHLHYHTE